MNDDYISRTAVLKICSAEHKKQLKKCNCAGDNAVSNIRSGIINLPSSNVIEVVRCKDCKEYNTHDCAEGFGWCEMWDLGKTDDQFCSYGKRADMRGDKR